MKKASHIAIAGYSYELPEDRIAKFPLGERDSSSLLLYNKGAISHTSFSQAPAYLDKGDKLFFNITRVVQARLQFQKESGARIEIFCLEPYEPADHQLAFSSREPIEMLCLIGNAKKWKNGVLKKELSGSHLYAEKLRKVDDKFIVRFSWDNTELSFGEILEREGSTPIPPYLNREAQKEDASTYQTIYAKFDGSVAAPTAGLHFTPELLAELDQKGIRRSELTLHVGAGTFIPVKTEDALDHKMHEEKVLISKDVLNELLMPGRTIAVGTTSTRSLESLYWLGVKALQDKLSDPDNLHLGQWEAYELPQDISTTEAFNSLKEFMKSHDRDTLSFSTGIMISPGYTFRVVDGLFTNFHQPKSTLLLLIAAFIGDDWKKVYDYALDKGFRFLSYGDSSLLLP